MEKKLYELKIDPELEAIIFPLTEEEFEGLKENILKNGCTDPLMVWNGIIADGHNRYRICRENNIPFGIEEVTGCETKDDLLLWMYERALDRRNLSDYTRTVIALRRESLLAERAEMRMKAGKKIDPVPNSAQGIVKGKTRDKVGKIAGKSHEFVDRVKRLEKTADSETKEKLHRGEITVNKAYTDLFGKKKESVPEPSTETVYIAPVNQEHEATPANVEVNGKKGIHVEGKMPDEEDSFPVVYSLLEDVARNYLVSLEHMLLQYTAGMVTEENNKAILSLFRGTAQEANNIIKKRIEEVSQ